HLVELAVRVDRSQDARRRQLLDDSPGTFLRRNHFLHLFEVGIRHIAGVAFCGKLALALLARLAQRPLELVEEIPGGHPQGGEPGELRLNPPVGDPFRKELTLDPRSDARPEHVIDISRTWPKTQTVPDVDRLLARRQRNSLARIRSRSQAESREK